MEEGKKKSSTSREATLFLVMLVSLQLSSRCNRLIIKIKRTPKDSRVISSEDTRITI